jgi:hypothetical protein
MKFMSKVKKSVTADIRTVVIMKLCGGRSGWKMSWGIFLICRNVLYFDLGGRNNTHKSVNQTIYLSSVFLVNSTPCLNKEKHTHGHGQLSSSESPWPDQNKNMYWCLCDPSLYVRIKPQYIIWRYRNDKVKFNFYFTNLNL